MSVSSYKLQQNRYLIVSLKGAYKCGPCRTGYAKNAIGKCRRIKLCEGKPGSAANPCSMYAECKAIGRATECKVCF